MYVLVLTHETMFFALVIPSIDGAHHGMGRPMQTESFLSYFNLVPADHRCNIQHKQSL